MSRRRILAPVAVAALAVAVVVPAQAGAGKPKPQRKTVGVVDYAFTPAKLRVTQGSRITWKWATGNSAPHDVKLISGPKGVKRFTSPTYTAGVSWSKVLTKPGTYRFICTYHANVMKETVVVR